MRFFFYPRERHRLGGLLLLMALLGCAPLPLEVQEPAPPAAGTDGGHVALRPSSGAISGELRGGLAEGFIGNVSEAQKRDEDTASKELGISPGQPLVVRMEEAHALPQQARPGETLRLSMQYTVLPPQRGQAVTVVERWDITQQGQPVGNPGHTVQRQGGTWVSVMPIALPGTAAPGAYKAVATVQVGKTVEVKEATFTLSR